MRHAHCIRQHALSCGFGGNWRPLPPNLPQVISHIAWNLSKKAVSHCHAVFSPVALGKAKASPSRFCCSQAVLARSEQNLPSCRFVCQVSRQPSWRDLGQGQRCCKMHTRCDFLAEVGFFPCRSSGGQACLDPLQPR